MTRLSSDILIIGGGAAGMSAALAAASTKNVSVTILDDNPRLGGQIWRADLGRTKSPAGLKIIAAVESGQVQIVNNAQVFATAAENVLLAETAAGTVEYEYKKCIIATGARELFLPFPGWTRPNVFGAAGLQALVKGGMKVENKRILVAGTGPLLLVVAEYLKSKGGKIVAIAEQAYGSNINKLAFGLWRSPAKLAQAAKLRAKLFGIPYVTDSWVTSCTNPRASKGEAADGGKPAQSENKNQHSVNLSRKGRSWTVECDLLACGFHLVPNNELAAILGCRVKDRLVVVNEFQETTRENIYCAGEPTAIGGVEAALIEGQIAGFAAVGEIEEARRLFAKRERTSRFTRALTQAFGLRPELKLLADDETIVCRCEDVEHLRLDKFDSWRTAKLQTRCGMGPCQGRVCGPAVEFLFDWTCDSVRPPIFPVKLKNL